MRALTSILAALLLLSACATTSPPPDEVAWEQIEGVTKATYLGNDRIKLDVQKPLFLGTEGMEFALLARAAGEAKARGAETFAIVRADYRQRLGFLSAELTPLRTQWIGTYEDLVLARERDTEGFGRITGISMIVLMAPQDDVMLRQSFDADETYGALVDAWIERQQL